MDEHSAEKSPLGAYSIWSEVKEWIKLDEAVNGVEVLPGDGQRGEALLRQLGLTAQSAPGAMALETGGIFFAHGWLRFLGSGSERMRGNLLSWNMPAEGERQTGLRDAFIVAHDVVGGVFAMNGGAFPGKRGAMYYLEPDSLRWRDLNGSYSQLLYWAANGDLEQFYRDVRWPGWQEEIAGLSGDQGLSIYPFLWANREIPVEQRSRRAVAMEELWMLEQDLAAQIRDLPPGAKIRFNVTEE